MDQRVKGDRKNGTLKKDEGEKVKNTTAVIAQGLDTHSLTIKKRGGK